MPLLMFSEAEALRFCNGCARSLPLDSFSPRADRPGQRRPRCKECHSRAGAIWRSLNPDYQREWVKANPTRVAASLRKRAEKLEALSTTQQQEHHHAQIHQASE
jgi:hypothetical protein